MAFVRSRNCFGVQRFSRKIMVFAHRYAYRRYKYCIFTPASDTVRIEKHSATVATACTPRSISIIWVVVWVISSVQVTVGHLLINPVPELGHVHVHAGGVFAATDSPSDDAGLMGPVGISVRGTSQWTSSVTLRKNKIKIIIKFNYKCVVFIKT